MRGRLIFPYTARIARLDPAAIEDAGPGAVGGMDDDFREPILETVSGRVIPVRRELATIDLPVQVEPETFQTLSEATLGMNPTANVEIIFHMRDLEDAGLVDANGRETLRPGDRITGFYGRNGALALAPRVPLFMDRITQRGWGMFSNRPNLLSVILVERPEGTPTVLP